MASLLLALAVGCSRESDEKLDPVPFTVVERDWHTGVRNAGQKVVSTPEEWKETWAAHQSNRFPPYPIPDVDFEKDVVLAVIAPAAGSSGYGVKILRIGRTPAELRVFVRHTGPAEGEVVSTVETRPVLFVRMEKPDRPVRFVVDYDYD